MDTLKPSIYELDNLSYKIEGYISSHPQKNEKQKFEDAKKELISNIERDIEIIKNMSFEIFSYRKKKGFRS